MPSPKALFLANRIFYSPLEILFTLFVFILSKNLEALPYQLTLIACIKPISSFFAFYANSFVLDHPQRIPLYLLINNLVGCSLCFFYPFVENLWFYIGTYTLFMITTRAVYPAWIEVLKSSLDAPALSKVISHGTSIYYLISILLPLLICSLMDRDENVWRYLFMGFAFLQLFNMALILFIKTDDKKKSAKPFQNPLIKGWTLLKEKPTFLHYQLLFFLGGAGIIASQAILPVYFKENLNLSYTQLGMAFSFCKGISFILASPYWAKISLHTSLYHLNCLINVFSCLFFVFIIAANRETWWLYLAYLFYGTMQAGCEMSWNLSGPFFSGPDESTIYSSLNLAFIGIRGCICPFLGYLLFIYSDAFITFLASTLLCLLGIAYGLWIHRKYQQSFHTKTHFMVPI